MGLKATAAAPSLINTRGLVSGYTINSVGDSLSALSFYQPVNLPASSAQPPQWIPNNPYIVGNVVVNNGLFYNCITQGTSAASGGPTGVTTNITDNTAHWAYCMPDVRKHPREMLTWIEAFSLRELQWNQSQGYGGIKYGMVKVIMKTGGTNYALGDTITFTGGASGVLVLGPNGSIAAINITNPGRFPAVNMTGTINTSTGSGATFTIIQNPAGTFGQTGNKTADVIADLPSITASTVDIFTVMIGTNDVFTNVPYATIVANLKIIYETILAAGKRVVAIPIFPRDSSLTTAIQNTTLQRVNKWIRAYYAKESWANPNGANIFLADVSRYMTDGTSTTNSPIGGAAAGANAMTVEGLHQSQRGAQYLAYVVVQALAALIGTLNPTAWRVAGMADGYSPTFNPSGNLLEGVPWQANQAYALGDHVSNDTAPVKIYQCTVAGTSAGSGGPTGTGGAITDNTVTWAYMVSQGLSVLAPIFDVVPAVQTGIAFTGNQPHNTVLKRNNGSASGTVITTQENPWSDGQVGQRMVISFSLGSGTNAEMWSFGINKFGTGGLGIESAALGVAPFYCEAEVEMSNLNRLINFSFGYTDNVANNGTFANEVGRELSQGSGFSYNLMNSSGEMLPYPNGGKILLRTEPTILPTNISSNVQLLFYWFFDASGAAGSATGTFKINYIKMGKAFVG